MGMAASQARFLGLTARKTNVEYEGQQINQQRTTLANQTANYYNQLLGMSVPVPPSVQDYTKTVYSFEDGNLSNSITSMFAKQNGNYEVSYVSHWENDFAPVSNGNAIVFRDDSNPNYNIYRIGNQTLRTLSALDDATYNYTERYQVYYGSSQTIGGYDMKNIYFSGTYSGDGKTYNTLRFVKNEDTNSYEFFDYETGKVITDTLNVTIAGKHASGSDFSFYPTGDSLRYYDGMNRPQQVSSTTIGHLNNAKIIIDHDKSSDPYLSTLSSDQLKQTLAEEREYITLLNNKYNNGDQTGEWLVRYVQNTTSGVYEPLFYKKSDVEDAIYDDGNTDASLSNIKCYKMGHSTETEEVKGVEARLEKDATGRYINIELKDKNGNYVKYALTTNTQTDQDAYNDAMNQYEFDKAKYDQSIQEINAKIEIIQAEDKNLELRLKQLDTEQDAIQTEMDAVQKVIEKNTESTFKTFG